MRFTQPLTSPLTSLAAVAAATAFAMPAHAQATADDDTAIQDAEEGIGAIVITAQRREQDLQDVPISVATVGDDTLAAVTAGGADIRGLAGRVPSLNVESSFGRTFPRFYIRGLGNTDFDLNASQPVSLVYDEVVLENPILKGFPAFDLDRIEVLRGPQGTLFGRNTPAGIVKFDTVKPGGSADNIFRASWGSYNTINVEAAVGFDIGNSVSVRASSLWQHRDDWIDNVDDLLDDNDLEGYDDIAGRLQIAIDPSDTFSLRLVGQLRDQRGSARIFRANSFATGSNELIGIDGGDFDRREVRHDGVNFQNLESWNVGAHADYDFGPATLYSVTSYWNGNLQSRGDIDGGFGNVFAPDMGPGFIPFSAQSQDNVPSLDQFTQEVRIASNNARGLGYQAGVFYFNEKLDISSFDFGTPQDLEPSAIALQRQESEALGIFGSVNYEFDNGLNLQAGIRYNHDERDFSASRPEDKRPGFLGFGGPVPTMTRSVEDDVITWDVAANYAASDDVNLYARVARGYRAPSIQGRLLFGRDISIADSETTMSYEAGIKTELLDNRVRFNLGGYHFVTEDLQLTAVGGGNNFTTLLNADKVRGQGFEAELTAKPTPGLTLTGGLSYNDTEIDSPGLGVAGCGAPCTVKDPVLVPAVGFNPAIFEIDGNPLPQAPKWTANWTAGYEHPWGVGDLYFFTDWYYRSKINFFLYESVEFSDDHLMEGGLRIGYRTDTYDVAAFVRNITNNESAVGGIDFNNLTGFVNEPRIFGVEIGFTL
ncbi:TonB-dependent receptor [Sphingomicrobium lutaoense]|uniref:Iron complex outermembrane receptor protein n=1 Tax=Sphingomicrobium lutaoense TaxID=515949 RepID=A0A839Z3M8_9SPHN|nr:TonB-dependent receptor [Sphingomicrobium lutaoense]MBB3764423.1 iron complex outermembrane receptor protein [Sphingomicrobium lutaoense]